MNDLRFALRQFLNNPGFTAVALLTLALGIGANTASSSALDHARLEPIGLVRQEGTGRPAGGRTTFAFTSYRTRNPSKPASRDAFGSKLQNT